MPWKQSSFKAFCRKGDAAQWSASVTFQKSFRKQHIACGDVAGSDDMNTSFRAKKISPLKKVSCDIGCSVTLLTGFYDMDTLFRAQKSRILTMEDATLGAATCRWWRIGDLNP
nr:hypothetical protein [Maliibacterium massiliense]